MARPNIQATVTGFSNPGDSTAASTPEPGTLILIGLGLGVLYLRPRLARSTI